jgi:hypothetical protein
VSRDRASLLKNSNNTNFINKEEFLTKKKF